MHDLNTTRPGLAYEASPRVSEVLAGLGRTEDIRFSPNNRRLAVASFLKHEITVFDIEIAVSTAGSRIALTGGVQLTSPALVMPHGLDFIDDDTLMVTSRGENASVFALPAGTSACPSVSIEPVYTWSAGPGSVLKVPGSVAVTGVTPDHAELLICNNAGNTVSSHVLRRSDGSQVGESRILLHKHLDVPDGLAFSADGRWLAISNHNTHSVLLYDRARALDKDAGPDALLRRVLYPHGLRFSRDGRYLFVADAGAPHVHVFACGADGWRGVGHPVATARVMSDAVFARGQHNPQEGGPKGLDIDRGGTVLGISCEAQPLAFFRLESLLEQPPDPETAMCYEIRMMEVDAMARTGPDTLELLVDYMKNSWSWKLTAPLRRVHSLITGRD